METQAHLWPCGCLKNDGGAHRRSCPDYRTVEHWDGMGFVSRSWTPRTTGAGQKESQR